MPRLRRPGRPTSELLDLLVRAGAGSREATGMLAELLADYPDRADLATTLGERETAADQTTHRILLALHQPGAADRAGLDPHDGHRLATALDDIVDGAEAVAEMLGVYGVEAPMEQADQLAATLSAAAEQVALALERLRDWEDLGEALVEIHRLENLGDRQHREAVGSLFASGVDPMMVIRWKDIFDGLEQTIDACETVAHQLEGIALKRRR